MLHHGTSRDEAVRAVGYEQVSWDHKAERAQQCPSSLAHADIREV